MNVTIPDSKSLRYVMVIQKVGPMKQSLSSGGGQVKQIDRFEVMEDAFPENRLNRFKFSSNRATGNENSSRVIGIRDRRISRELAFQIAKDTLVRG
jgi:hypothetical protein